MNKADSDHIANYLERAGLTQTETAEELIRSAQ